MYDGCLCGATRCTDPRQTLLNLQAPTLSWSLSTQHLKSSMTFQVPSGRRPVCLMCSGPVCADRNKEEEEPGAAESKMWSYLFRSALFWQIVPLSIPLCLTLTFKPSPNENACDIEWLVCKTFRLVRAILIYIRATGGRHPWDTEVW